MTDQIDDLQPTSAFKLGKVAWVTWRSLVKDRGVLLPIVGAMLAVNYAITFFVPPLGWLTPPLLYAAGASTLTHLALSPHYVALEEAIGVGKRAWLTVFGACIVGGIIIVIGLNMAFIPGLIGAALMIPVIPIIMAERPNPKAIFERTVKMTAPVGPPAFGMVAATVAITGALMAIFFYWSNNGGPSARMALPLIETLGIVVLIYLATAIYIVRTVRADLYYQALTSD